MTRHRYLVRISRDAHSDWGASVPDLPGCVATGRTVDTALRRLRGAIRLHLQGMRADGVRVPRPRQKVVLPRQASRRTDVYTVIDVAA